MTSGGSATTAVMPAAAAAYFRVGDTIDSTMNLLVHTIEPLVLLYLEYLVEL